jgi:hypothetical protein
VEGIRTDSLLNVDDGGRPDDDNVDSLTDENAEILEIEKRDFDNENGIDADAN